MATLAEGTGLGRRGLAYLEHFKLRDAPFSTTPNAAYAYAHHSMLEGLHQMRNVVIGRSGLGMISGEIGLGKALDLDTKILTPRGFKKMRHIYRGDTVIGRDGLPHTVTGVFPQGRKPAFRVTFTDGASTTCCDEHLWAVRTSMDAWRDTPYRVLPLSKIREKLIGSNGQSARWFIPVVSQVQFPERILPLDPYLLGALLGDASFRGGSIGGSVRFSCAEPELLQTITTLLPTGTDLAYVGYGVDYRVRKFGSRTSASQNHVSAAILDLGLAHCSSSDKFIPEPYLYAGVDARLALLQGLMDTDGTPGDHSTELCTVSDRLADDVTFLVQSLGGIARRRTRLPTYNYNGDVRNGKLAHRINIKLPSGLNPFRLERKRARYTPPTKYFPNRAIASVEEVGEREMQCIAVDSPDHLFVIEDCIVTHNTTLARLVADDLGAHDVPAVYFPNVPGGARQTEASIMREIAMGLKLKTRAGNSADLYYGDIAEFADSQHNDSNGDRTTVIIIDDAQDLKRTAVRALLRLLALQTKSDQLIQVLLFGQNPEMLDAIRADRALHSRLSAHVELEPFDREEVAQMLAHRLKVAGRSQQLFTEPAITLLADVSRGIPRIICRTANQACIHAADRNAKLVDVRDIELAAQQLKHRDG